MTYMITDIHGRQRRQKLRPHRAHRNVALFRHTTEHHAILATEADATRWWLQDQDMWLHSCNTVTLNAYNPGNDSWSDITTYPIYEDPDLPIEQRIVSYFLGFSAQIYLMSNLGLVPFNFDGRATQFELEFLITQLRRIRRAQ